MHQPQQLLGRRPSSHVLLHRSCKRPGRPAAAVVGSTTTTQQATRPKIELNTLEEALVVAEDFNRCFSTSLYQEHHYTIEKIEGQLPLGLKGTLLRNGPGLFEVGGKHIPHPFDGDGLVCAIAFDGQGGATFTNKFVRTRGFVAERRAGKQLYRSAFNRSLPDGQGLQLQLPGLGTVKLANPLDFKTKDVSNIMVLHWGGKTVALSERGMPHLLNERLATLGPDTLGDSVAAPGAPDHMAAHLRMTQERDGSSRVVLFSSTEQGTNAQVTFQEYDAEFNMLHRTQVVLPGAAFGFFHDFAVSEQFYVLVENRMEMDLWKLLTKVPVEQASIAECLQFRPELPCRLHLVPRPGKGVPGDEGARTFEVPGGSMFTFHLGNAFALEADGSSPAAGTVGRYLVVDTVSARRVDFSINTLNAASANYYGVTDFRSEPTRLVLDWATGSVSRTSMTPRGCEFPCVAPSRVGRPHHHMWIGASAVQGGTWFSPNQVLMKLSVDPANGMGADFAPEQVQQAFWSPGSTHEFVGEPVFVPRNAAGEQGAAPAEDDGWLLAMVFNTAEVKSYVVVVDARDMQQVAKLHLPHHVPAGLHGMFTPEFLGPPVGSRAHVYDIRQGV